MPVLEPTIDPVCGMEMEVERTTNTVTHKGAMYYFCSKDCKEEFEADPEEYIDVGGGS